MDLQFKSVPFEIKATAQDGSSFEGKCAHFFNIDSYGEIVDDEAFDQDLPAFLSDGFIGGLNHDWDHPIGRPMPDTKPMSDHLHLKASVVDTMHGMDCMKLLKAGVIRKLSIGYRVMGDMMLETEDECMAYWERKGYKPNATDMARCKAGARVLTRVHLYEASPVTVPANDLATITAVKAAREAAEKAFRDAAPEFKFPTSEREFEEFLRDAGFSRSQSVAITNHGYKSVLRDAASDDADPAPEAKSDDAPADDAATPAPTEETPEPSETLEGGDEPDAGAAIVTEPVPPTDPPDADADALPDIEAGNSAQLEEEKAKTARLIAQRQALLDANIELAFSRFAGR